MNMQRYTAVTVKMSDAGAPFSIFYMDTNAQSNQRAQPGWQAAADLLCPRLANACKLFAGLLLSSSALSVLRLPCLREHLLRCRLACLTRNNLHVAGFIAHTLQHLQPHLILDIPLQIKTCAHTRARAHGGVSTSTTQEKKRTWMGHDRMHSCMAI